MVGGFHRVPDGPGLGIAVDKAAIERYRIPLDHPMAQPNLTTDGAMIAGSVPAACCSATRPDLVWQV
jgi:hypothetical protein